MKSLTFFRYFAYSIEILVLYILQGTPNLIPEIFGSKPLLLLPAAVCIAAGEKKIPAMIFGAVCGLLTDLGSGGGVGFFAISLTILCYAQVHIFENYFVASFVTVIIVSAVIIPCVICIYFLLFIVLSGTDDCGYMFLYHYASRIIYSFLTVIPLYFLNRLIYKNL